MGVKFYPKGKIDVTRKTHRRGLFCICGALKALPSEVRKQRNQSTSSSPVIGANLTEDELRILFKQHLTSRGVDFIRPTVCSLEHKNDVVTDGFPWHGRYFTVLNFAPQGVLNLTSYQSRLWWGFLADVPGPIFCPDDDTLSRDSDPFIAPSPSPTPSYIYDSDQEALDYLMLI